MPPIIAEPGAGAPSSRRDRDPARVQHAAGLTLERQSRLLVPEQSAQLLQLRPRHLLLPLGNQEVRRGPVHELALLRVEAALGELAEPRRRLHLTGRAVEVAYRL